MTYENEIPEYAMQPAKAPEIIEADGIYHMEKIIYPEESQSICYEFEEDILVPDIKPDMREIFLMDAQADIIPCEKKIMPKTDDLLNITGTITVQTLYGCEEDDGKIVSIVSKVPYKYQWNLNPTDKADGVFNCKVKKLEYMIVNERKFRVRITLEFIGRLFCEKELAFFSGLKKESLEMKRKGIMLSCLGLTKNDEISIEEEVSLKEEVIPEYILKQNYVVTESYRQITPEKVVINGFIFCNILYSAQDNTDEEPVSVIRQQNERIEFTEFVPINKESREKKWNDTKIIFDCTNMNTEIETQADGEKTFKIHGNIKMRVELYEQREQEMIVDAYHKEKNFECEFQRKKLSAFEDLGVIDISLHEIVNVSEGEKLEEVVYSIGKVETCKCIGESDRIETKGNVEINTFWKDSEGKIRINKITPEFRGTTDIVNNGSMHNFICQTMVKETSAKIINDKQMEINCSVSINIENADEREITLLQNPHFISRPKVKEYPMVIVKMKEEDTLWELAKKYRSTEDEIIRCNHLEGIPAKGQKLLIVK